MTADLLYSAFREGFWVAGGGGALLCMSKTLNLAPAPEGHLEVAHGVCV